MSEVEMTPEKTHVVLVAPAGRVLQRLRWLDSTVSADSGLRRCMLWVVVEDTAPAAADQLAEQLQRAKPKEWHRTVEILVPEALERRTGRGARGRYQDLVDYLALTLIPKRIRNTAEHGVCLVWDAGDSVIAAAGSAVSAILDNVRWVEPPQSPWSHRVRSQVRDHQLAPIRNAGAKSELRGESDAIRLVRYRLQVFAGLSFPVLLVGETGTGKEICARELHLQGSSPHTRFASINGAMLDPARAGSELFGHVKGAFTGAVRTHSGRIAEADGGGTFFLDELDSVPVATQGHLLRALQHVGDRFIDVDPLGSEKTTPRRIHARFISAVQPDSLENEVIRTDLLFRVSELRVDLPPLRERGDDALLLADQFIQDVVGHLGDGPRKFAKGAQDAIRDARWPGNVRELRTAVRQGFVLARARNSSVIERRDLPVEVHSPRARPDPGESGAPLRSRLARLALDACNLELALHEGNKTAAARTLGFRTGQELERFRESSERALGSHRRRPR